MADCTDTVLTLRYLGVAGWELSTSSHRLWVDPYFTRLPLWTMLFGRAIPDRQNISRYIPPAMDGILISHAHYDHLMDVPEVARLTGARVYTSPQGCALLGVLGVPVEQCTPLAPGGRLQVGSFTVEVYRTPHRVIFGRVPYQAPLRMGLKPPLRARDYRMDEQYSFLIQVGGLRVLIASGIDDEPPVAADVLMVGADASWEQLARILNATRPRIVLPNHWDDMFRPLNKPIRPMIEPTRRIAIPRRIDLKVWREMVKALAPQAQVVIPQHLIPYKVKSLLSSSLRSLPV